MQPLAFPQQMGAAYPMSPKFFIIPVRPPAVMDGNAGEIWKNASIVHAGLATAFIHRLVGGIRRGGCVHVLLFSVHPKICFIKVDHSTAEHFPADVL